MFTIDILTGNIVIINCHRCHRLTSNGRSTVWCLHWFHKNKDCNNDDVNDEDNDDDDDKDFIKDNTDRQILRGTRTATRTVTTTVILAMLVALLIMMTSGSMTLTSLRIISPVDAATVDDVNFSPTVNNSTEFKAHLFGGSNNSRNKNLMINNVLLDVIDVDDNIVSSINENISSSIIAAAAAVAAAAAAAVENNQTKTILLNITASTENNSNSNNNASQNNANSLEPPLVNNGQQQQEKQKQMVDDFFLDHQEDEVNHQFTDLAIFIKFTLISENIANNRCN